MAGPKKNPLIGAFRAPVPGAPPGAPAPPEAGKPPAAEAAKPLDEKKGPDDPKTPVDIPTKPADGKKEPEISKSPADTPTQPAGAKKEPDSTTPEKEEKQPNDRTEAAKSQGDGINIVSQIPVDEILADSIYSVDENDPSFKKLVEDIRKNGLKQPIGINRNGQLAVLQLRPSADASRAALQWVSLGSNVFNALVPFYAGVTETPDYLANTTTTVTTDSFYWANRLVAALADAAYGACLPHVERYQERLTSRCAALIRACDLANGDLEPCNQAIADECRRETDELLSKVLYESSMRMRNGFARSDN